MLATIGAAIDRRSVRRRARGSAAGRADPRSADARQRNGGRTPHDEAGAAESGRRGRAVLPGLQGRIAIMCPPVVDHLIQRGEFLTAYTPYQPEIAQGTLQMLFEFQTQVARLLGCDVANASMYDGSTACWEAIGMARRITKRGNGDPVGRLHPHYVAVAKTMAKFTGDALVHRAADA